MVTIHVQQFTAFVECKRTSAENVVSRHVGKQLKRRLQKLVVRGQRWQVHGSCTEHLMREIDNREFTLPPLDRLVAARGRRQGIWTTLVSPCLNGMASWVSRTHCTLEGGPPILQELSTHMCSCMYLRQTVCTRCLPIGPLVPISQRSENPTILP